MTARAGLRLPAEWEPQSGILLTWPHGHGDFKPWLSQVEPVFVEIARQVARFESLWIVCRDQDHQIHVADLLRAADVAAERLHLHIVPSNDTWARDHGPITVLGAAGPVLVDFHFNGWGGKYPAELDDQITARLHALRAFGDSARVGTDLILEGGAIDGDGAGTLLTTRRCLLAATRNPGLDRAGMERRLAELLGVTRILWLEHGALAGDDTDGHVDTLARFCDSGTIAYQDCEDPLDEHYPELRAMARELEGFRTRDGRPYRLIPLPMPGAVRNAEGHRLPAGYANFLVINGAVLVPVYGDPADAVALARLRRAFPDREVVPVSCTPLLYQYGSLHCVTMQLSAAVGCGRP
ncbi:MAG: agmatine deiminase [Chromatiales bacterium 21-64-14]|nr:MAG: agmatine deiminase [Chromatiales bacterium 21-64-14]HQU16705.1 agmatine deiminase family protein [Gammaproteobacteria bacterium]